MKIFLAGHNGMVGRAIHKKLLSNGIDVIIAEKEKLNLLNQLQVANFLKNHKPDAVIIAAAKVGGIHANNSFPAEFIYENLMIECNLIHQSFINSIEKVLFLGSSCIYPKFSIQPIKESELLSGYLEQTNEAYALAKISGIKLCEAYSKQYGMDYRSIMPTNLYGPNDNFHKLDSHVIPALIRRFHEHSKNNSPEILVWGSGMPKREFLHVEDMADASLFIMDLEKSLIKSKVDENCSHINVGFGSDVSIKDLSELIADITNYQGEILFDKTKPDGTPRKLLDSSIINSMGWHPQIDLRSGIMDTYQWFLNNINSLRC